MDESEKSERPLITFALITYNQEKYVREAIEGAFAQTYSPLEIILSDDCSSDRTYEIMEEMADAYTGPHCIKLNCNSVNQGIARHIDFVGKQSSGDLVVLAAGDDISLAERVETIFGHWVKNDYGCCAFQSSYMKIGTGGEGNGISRPDQAPEFKKTEDALKTSMSFGGATGAYHADVFKRFPEIIEGVFNEDRIIVARFGMLGGSFHSIDGVLVHYRLVGITSKFLNDLPTKENSQSVKLELLKREQRDIEQGILDVSNFVVGRKKKKLLSLLKTRQHKLNCHIYWMGNQSSISGLLLSTSMNPGAILSALKILFNRKQRMSRAAN